MRALAHPVRVALLELLGRDGPMTATQAGEALGESPANASFHLRTLAKYGFVEEAPAARAASGRGAASPRSMRGASAMIRRRPQQPRA